MNQSACLITADISNGKNKEIGLEQELYFWRLVCVDQPILLGLCRIADEGAFSMHNSLNVGKFVCIIYCWSGWAVWNAH